MLLLTIFIGIVSLLELSSNINVSHLIILVECSAFFEILTVPLYDAFPPKTDIDLLISILNEN